VRNINLGTSTTTELKYQVLSTNFTIPLVPFNTVTKESLDNNQKGNVALFNSVGPGISYNWGRMTITTDATGKAINTEMQNTFGFQLGVLFATNSSSGNNANVFASTFSLAVLNFQLGCRYELGTISPKERQVSLHLSLWNSVSKIA
jgi:hypothetical protein